MNTIGRKLLSTTFLFISITMVSGVKLMDDANATAYATSEQHITNFSMTAANADIAIIGAFDTASNSSAARQTIIPGCANNDPADAVQCILGAPNPGENVFSPQGQVGDYIRGDALISSTDLLTGAGFAENIAEGFTTLSLLSSSDGENALNAEFSLSADSTVTFDLDAVIHMFTEMSAGDMGFAESNVEFSVHIDEHNAGQGPGHTHLFEWTPSELNQAISSLTPGEIDTYDFMGSLSVTTDILLANTTYDMNIDMVESVNMVSDIPEPGSWALLGVGLLGMMFTRRKIA